MRLPLEMRITGGSSVHLASQYGNHGTCSIEVLTPENVKIDEWNEFMQETTDSWLSLKDDDGNLIHPFKNDDGQLLYCRPHWAKEWMGLEVNGEPINDYLKDKAFKDQIPPFLGGLKAVAEAGKYKLEDANNIFSTSFSRDFFPYSVEEDDNGELASPVDSLVANGDFKNDDGKNFRSINAQTETKDDNKAEEDEEKISENDEEVTQLSLPGGRSYIGCIKDGKMHGVGKLTWSTGAVYEGEWLNNKINGSGTYKKADGSVYVGSWKDGMKNGTGLLTWMNGDVYEGEYMQDKKHGNGVYKYANGSVYDGAWELNQRNGIGALTYKNGDVYEGEFKNDKRNGKGTYTYASGNIFKGGWVNGKKNGPGVKSYKSGKVQVGTWEDDKFVKEF